MPTKKQKKEQIKFQKELGERIRKARKSLGFTQEQFAKKSRIHRVNIAQLETGKKSLPLFAFKKLCNILKTDLSKLLKGL